MRLIFAVLLAVSAVAADDPAARDMLALHNALRATVNVQALVWSDRLAAAAAEWATALVAHGRFEHSDNKHYGENLAEFRGGGGKTTAKQAFALWSVEVRDYDYKSNHCRGKCGHYTQVVWRNTREVGCAVVRGAGREVWVCEYSPPGNYVGQRPY